MDERERKLQSLEQEKADFMKEVQELKQIVVRQSESIRKKEERVLKHKNDIYSALEVVHGDGLTSKTQTEVRKASPLPFESLISRGVKQKRSICEELSGFSKVDEEIAELDDKFNALKRNIL